MANLPLASSHSTVGIANRLRGKGTGAIKPAAIVAMLPLIVAGPLTLMASEFTISQATLAAALLIAAITDIQNQKIYNWLTYPLFAHAFVFALLHSILPSWTGLAGVEIADFARGATTCFAITFVAYSASQGGAGDVKLAAGIGGFLGAELGILVIAATYAMASVYGLFVALLHGQLRPLVTGMVWLVLRRCGWPTIASSDEQQKALRKPVPLAGFFALATAVVLLSV